LRHFGSSNRFRRFTAGVATPPYSRGDDFEAIIDDIDEGLACSASLARFWRVDADDLMACLNAAHLPQRLTPPDVDASDEAAYAFDFRTPARAAM